MEDSEFHDRVARTGEIDDPEPLTEATLRTLGEAITAGQAEELAAHLPDRYAETITTAGGADSEIDEAGATAEPLSYDDVLDRIHDRALENGFDTDSIDETRTHVSAVTETLAEVVPHEEYRSTRSQLPDAVESLFTEGEGVR